SERTPLGMCSQAGRRPGNPSPRAAGLAARDRLPGAVYTGLMARARRTAGVLRDACSAAGLAAQFPVVGTLFGMYLGDGPLPTNFDQAKTTNEAAYGALFRAAREHGLALAPGAYEAVF